MAKCEFCGCEHDGTYGSGRFCSPTCARKYSNTFVTEDGRANQIKALNDEENRRKGIESNIKHTKSKPKKQYRNDLRPKFKHTLTLGKVGELEVSKKFIEHGYDVYTPLVDAGNGIDLVVANENGFKTVQVKSSTDSKINSDGICESTMFKICKNVRHIHEGSYSQTQEKYSPDVIDYVALYSACDDEAYLFENSNELPMSVTIRNITSMNWQNKKINYAEDYQIDKVLDEINLTKGVYYDECIIDCEYKEIY